MSPVRTKHVSVDVNHIWPTLFLFVKKSLFFSQFEFFSLVNMNFTIRMYICKILTVKITVKIDRKVILKLLWALVNLIWWAN